MQRLEWPLPDDRANLIAEGARWSEDALVKASRFI